MPSQQVLEEKSSEVEAIKDILKEYKSIGIASLKKVRASQLQELKKSMAGKVYLRVLKNTLIKIAIEELNQEDLKKLEEYLEGSNVFLFTDLNPFKLALLLEHGKVKTTAKVKRHSSYGCGYSSRQHGPASRTSYQSTKRSWLANPNRIWQRLGQQGYPCRSQGRSNKRSISRCSFETRHKSR